jgi:tetratricopeptide (TPR) repeat protein
MVTVRIALMLALLLRAGQGAPSASDHYKAGRNAFGQKPDEAVRQFEQAVSLDDKNADYHYWLARALGNVAQSASVIRQPLLARRVKSEFERVLQLDPSNISGREGLLQFYLQAPGIMGGSASKAREQAADIAKLSPLRGHLAQATIANFEKDRPAAEREDRAAATGFPDSIVAVTALANLLANSNRSDEAFVVVDRYLARKPGDVLALWWVGRAAATTGIQLERGEQALRAVLMAPGVGTDPNLPAPANIHFRLGDILAKKGAKEQARKEYEKALELNPQLDAARKALKAL